jgi:hypothetical protein
LGIAKENVCEMLQRKYGHTNQRLPEPIGFVMRKTLSQYPSMLNNVKKHFSLRAFPSILVENCMKIYSSFPVKVHGKFHLPLQRVYGKTY